MDAKSDSPQPRSISMLFARLPTSQTRNAASSLLCDQFKATDDPSQELAATTVGSVGSRLSAPGCFLRVASGSRTEGDIDMLVSRVREFFELNPNIHTSETRKLTWKCNTIWLKFRVQIVDGGTVQVERRFGCSSKMREIKCALYAHLTNSTCCPRRKFCAIEMPNPDSENKAEIQRMAGMLRSGNIGSQLLALEAISHCDTLLRASSLFPPVKSLSMSSHGKVSVVAQHVQKRQGSLDVK